MRSGIHLRLNGTLIFYCSKIDSPSSSHELFSLAIDSSSPGSYSTLNLLFRIGVVNVKGSAQVRLGADRNSGQQARKATGTESHTMPSLALYESGAAL